MNRRVFNVTITVNDRRIRNVIIDPHYELKHSATINDKLIVELVQLLDGGDFTPDAVDGNFEYFAIDKLMIKGKSYRLIWLLENDQMYVGVINAYRRKS